MWFPIVGFEPGSGMMRVKSFLDSYLEFDFVSTAPTYIDHIY